MGKLQTSVGLYSGLDINSLVTQLISIEARPQTILKGKVDENSTIQSAITGLTLTLASAQLTSSRLSSTQAFASRKASSSSTAIVASAGPKATTGSFTLTPKRQVTTQQIMSDGFASKTSKVGAGTITIARGGFVDRGTELSNLNGGLGVPTGSIQITNRQGGSSQVDLTAATTLQEVVDTINGTSGLSVRASVSGDSLQLEDLTGGAGNIVVQEVGGGKTAAGLGILGSTAGAVHTGSDILQLGNALSLNSLNDGNGVRSFAGLDDFTITDDSGSYGIDISGAASLGDAVEEINAQSGGAITASIVDNKLQLTGTGTITVARNQDSTGNDIKAADDLGILGSSGGGVLTGSNILGGLNTVLLKNLNGGSGAGTAGTISINGNNIDLAGAETLNDVVAGINAAGVAGVTARVNDSKNGLLIESTGGALEIADVSGGLAAGLNIESTAVENLTSVNSGSLKQKFISENTRLDSLNGGAGVPKGKIRITDGNGLAAVIDLTQETDDSIAAVLRDINSRGLAVHARVNDDGDGILLENTAGSGIITVAEEGSTGTAKALNLLGSSVAGGDLNGSSKVTIELTATDTVNDLVTKLAEANAPVFANLINDGSSINPVRLNLSSKQSGASGQLLIETGTTSLNLNTISQGRDAVVLFGSGEGGLSPIQLKSASNTFNDVLPGVNIDIAAVSSQPVVVTVSEDTDAVVDAVSDFVDSFNSVKQYISSFRTFDPETEQKGILFNEASVRSAENLLNGFINSSLSGTGSKYRSLVELGITLNGTGQLSFDEDKFRDKLEEDPEAVSSFFTAKDVGATAKFKSLVEGLTDPVDGMLTNRVDVIGETIARQNLSILQMQDRLDVRQERLFNQFVGLELALSEMSIQQGSLEQLSLLASSTALSGFSM